MGICCSKKKQQPLSPPSPPLVEKKKNADVAVGQVEVEKKRNDTTTTTTMITTISRRNTQQVVEAEKKPVSVIITAKPAPTDSNSSEEKQQKKNEIKAVPLEEPRPAAAAGVRTSSCTKEEVDAILIQCGRLSRSSSGNATNEAGRGHRKYSGSKRSYDFDNDKSSTSKDEDEDWEAKLVSRPSPRRRTPGRERDGGSREHLKRSGSRERGRGGTGSPRVSRSPGRRSDGPGSSSSASDKPRQQPGKLVSLPAREKGGVKRNAAASSRSNSPAKNAIKLAHENALHQPQPQPQPQSLSRSSSRKGEESPYRRNPMAEVDVNSLRPNQKAPKSREGEEVLRKPSPVRSQRTSDKRSGSATSTDVPKGSNNNNNNISIYVREQLMSCRANEKLRESETVTDTQNVRTLTRTRSSRRSSKDFDHHHPAGPNPEDAFPNPNSYASLLLEDIQNYHQQSAAAAVPFSLPACVSKACSILDAVADLNSSSSDYSGNDNVRLGRGSFSGEPGLHKYIPETEPQESAGSNSFVMQPPWASLREPNSADSTDRRWAPQPDDAEEEVAFDSQGKGSRGGGGSRTAMTPGKKREADHQRQLNRGGGYVNGGGNI